MSETETFENQISRPYRDRDVETETTSLHSESEYQIHGMYIWDRPGRAAGAPVHLEMFYDYHMKNCKKKQRKLKLVTPLHAGLYFHAVNSLRNMQWLKFNAYFCRVQNCSETSFPYESDDYEQWDPNSIDLRRVFKRDCESAFIRSLFSLRSTINGSDRLCTVNCLKFTISLCRSLNRDSHESIGYYHISNCCCGCNLTKWPQHPIAAASSSILKCPEASWLN
jgi:hypothetical protein